MALFRCLIRGENFPGQIIGLKGLIGFYTTRFIEAADTEEAELAGLEMLRADPDLQIKSEKLKQQEPLAKVYFEEIIQVVEDTERKPNRGATWFEMK